MAAQSLGQADRGPLAVAVDLGGTRVRAALVDSAGTVLAKAAEATKADAGPPVVLGQIASLVARVSVGADREVIKGAGVSSPGPLDSREGMALGIPTLAGFAGYPLRDALSDVLAMPVALDNDGICAAIGEWRFGAGRGVENLVYVTVSTGIGGGVIAGGRVLRGRKGLACHVGHMSFMAGGDVCFCGNRGCFEAYASGTAFTRRAIAAARREATAIGAGGAAIDAEAVFAAARAGDDLALRLVGEEARFLGQGFASLLHLYSPDLLVMGGGLSNQFNMMHNDLLAQIRVSAMVPFRDTPVVKAALGGESGLIGAAALVFDPTL